MRLRSENNTKLLSPVRHFILPQVGISPRMCTSVIEDHSSLGSLSCLNNLSLRLFSLGHQPKKGKRIALIFLLSIVLFIPARSRFLSYMYT